MKKRLFLIDGNSFCYRAYYAIKELKNTKGKPTNAIYGFVLMLKKLLSQEKPDYLGIGFDVKEPTFRHKKFKDYKLNRPPMPNDLISQFPMIKSIVRAYNIPIFEKEGFEAEDILATIAKGFSKKDIEIYIVTGDKDVLQLVEENIKTYYIHKTVLIYDVQKVRGRFSGLGPENVVDIMALAGDITDNIPGVKGIGEKTAIELIKEFHNIENLYSNLSHVQSESKRRLLEENRDNAFMSKELATIDTFVPIQVDIESMRIKEPDSKKLGQLFKELEFRSFAKELSFDDGCPRQGVYFDTIATIDKLDVLSEEIKKEKEFVLDFVTSDTSLSELIPAGISFCYKLGKVYYIPLINLSACSHSQADKSEISTYIQYVLSLFKGTFEDETIGKIGHNIKHSKLILSRYGIDLKGISFDTMVADYLLNPSKLSHSLDDVAFEHLDYKLASISDILGTGKKKISMEDLTLETISQYSCESTDIIMRLKEIFEKELFEKELDKLFREIELPLIDVLSSMEKNGIKIDVQLLKKASFEIERELSHIVQNIYTMAGSEFNINSHKQLSEILFNRLNLPVIKKTNTGISTDVGVLETLAGVHPLPKEILRYRELSKLKSTYIDALPELINPHTKRLHSSFNQTVTATGRLSSSRPNLQNIPIKTEQARVIRKAFIGEDDNLIMSADYSQIELRILAHLSKDDELISSFENGRDIHTHTASLMFGVKESDVTPEMRANAKTVNFGIIYGMSAFGLSKSLFIDTQSAQNFIDSYFERYPGVKQYIDRKIEEAKDIGYVTTIFNRRRYIPEIKNGGMREQQQAERIAINTPIQGSSADLIKIAMINIFKEMREKRLYSMMILQVHDELVFEVVKEELDIMQELVKRRMESACLLSVPIEVTIRYGKNWLESSMKS